MSFNPSDFIKIALDNNVLRFGEYTLKSGRISPYFFFFCLLATGELLSVLASGYADALANDADKDNVVIFGAAYKGSPCVAAAAQA